MSRHVYIYTFFKKRSKFCHAGLEGKFCHKLKEPTDFMQRKNKNKNSPSGGDQFSNVERIAGYAFHHEKPMVETVGYFTATTGGEANPPKFSMKTQVFG